MMEGTDPIFEKFVKYINRAQLHSNDMRFPPSFFEKYANWILNRLVFKLRNGYELPVFFDKENRRVMGLSSLFEDFDFDGGEMLVFEYFGGSVFYVYIIGTDFTEIDYPSIVHSSQKSKPRIVSMRNGGLRFVKFVTEKKELQDDIYPPASFMGRLPLLMQPVIRYVLSNGKKFDGKYDLGNKKFSGLRPMCDISRLNDLGCFNMFLFVVQDVGIIEVSAFEDSFMEQILPGTPLSTGANSVTPAVHASFEILVKPSHMNKYSYGVDISSDLKELWYVWRKTDYIRVYSGNRAWKLQIRHRSRWERTTIHDGWLQFRDDMELQEGDTCVFECPIRSYDHFTVRVTKNQG